MKHSRFRFLSLVFAAVVGLRVGASSQSVVAIKDKDITPYNKAISGIEEICESKVHILDLDHAEKEGQDLKSQVSKLSPDAIVTVGRNSADWTAKHFKDTPTVFCMHPSPEASFGDKNNAVGISLQVPPKTQFEALKKVASGVKGIGIVYCHSSLDAITAEGKKDAQRIGLKYIAKRIDDPSKLGVTLNEMMEGLDAIWVLPDRDLISPDNARLLILMSVDYGVPLLVYSGDFVRKGALLAVYPDFVDTGRKAALLVNGIVGGATPASLTPEFPSTLWAINLNMAKRLNITVPAAIKSRAEVLIE